MSAAAAVAITKQHLLNLFGDDSTVIDPKRVDAMDALGVACQAMHSIAGDIEILAHAAKDEHLTRSDLAIAIRGVALRLAAAGTIASGFGDLAHEGSAP